MQDQINIEKLSDTKRKISIKVSSPNVDKKFNDFFESIKNNTQVPGFRKGKAPVARLRQFFGNKAKASVSQMILSDYYNRVIGDNDLNPIGNPRVENLKPTDEYPGKFDFDNTYTVDLTIEVLPKLDPTGYIGMKIDFPQHNEDDLFNARMATYQEQFAERKQVNDRGAKFGDSIVIDFKGFVDDIQFEGGTAQGFSVEKLGAGSFIPGFEDQIVNTKTGETKDVMVTFPKEYRAQHLAGKEAKFEVTVQSIVETNLAKVDNDLAMMAGFETVDQLITHVKGETEKEKRLRDRQMLDHMIISKLLEDNNFEAPESLVESEKLRLLGKVKLHSLPPQAQSELNSMALYNVKRAIISDAIYEKESNVEVTPEQLNEMLEEHAQKSNQTKDELVSNLYNSGQMDNFLSVLRLANVMDFIIDNADKESEEENGNN